MQAGLPASTRRHGDRNARQGPKAGVQAEPDRPGGTALPRERAVTCWARQHDRPLRA